MTAHTPRRWLYPSILAALAALAGCQPAPRAQAPVATGGYPHNVIVMINDGAGWGTLSLIHI